MSDLENRQRMAADPGPIESGGDWLEWGVTLYRERFRLDETCGQTRPPSPHYRAVRQLAAIASAGVALGFQNALAENRRNFHVAMQRTIEMVERCLTGKTCRHCPVDDAAEAMKRRGDVVFHAAFLLPVAEREEWLETIRALRRDVQRNGLALELSGPRPPHHFSLSPKHGAPTSCPTLFSNAGRSVAGPPRIDPSPTATDVLVGNRPHAGRLVGACEMDLRIVLPDCRGETTTTADKLVEEFLEHLQGVYLEYRRLSSHSSQVLRLSFLVDRDRVAMFQRRLSRLPGDLSHGERSEPRPPHASTRGRQGHALGLLRDKGTCTIVGPMPPQRFLSEQPLAT